MHVEQIDLSQVKRVDFEIISYLKDSHPDLYRSLRRAVKGRQKQGTGGTAPFSEEGGAIPDDIEGQRARRPRDQRFASPLTVRQTFVIGGRRSPGPPAPPRASTRARALASQPPARTAARKVN